MAVIDKVKEIVGLKSTEQVDEEQRASRAVRIWKADANSRRTTELEWWRNDTFHRGQSFVFNKSSKKLEEAKIKDKIFVNKARQQVRGVVSYLNKEHPFIHIQPGLQSDQAYSNAKNVQHLCSYWYDHLQMNATNKKVTNAGARFGLGWAKIMWNPRGTIWTKAYKHNGKSTNKLRGEVSYDFCDTYDVYADPRMTSWDDCRRITHVLPRTLGELKANPDFKDHASNIVVDDKLAGSELKQAFMARGVGLINESENVDMDTRTVLLLEQFTKEYTKEGEEQIRVTYVTAGGCFLHTKIWPLAFFPFEYYQTDVCDNIHDSDGAIKHIRPLNEALNRSASQMEDNADRMGKLHYIVEKGSGINVIHDKVGTIMEVSAGKKDPTQVKPSALPAYVENHQGNLERWIDDIGGIHDASYGKLPTSRASGELVKGLQEGDNNSLAMYRDNFDDFLARVFKKMLLTEKYHRSKQGVSRQIRMKELDPLGRYTWVDIKADDICIDDEIQVRSGTNMPFSNSARQGMVMDLYKEGLFNGSPQANAALKLMSLPEVENVLGNEQPHIERQGKELDQITKGKQIDSPVVSEDHNIHIRVIDQFVNSPAWYKLSEQQRKDLLDHRRQHADLQEQISKAAAANNVEPIKRSEVISVQPKDFASMTPVERVQLFSKFGIMSDMDEVQIRGGLNIQNPQEAVQQADIENQMFAKGNAPKVSVTDNHPVHLEAHMLLKNSPTDYDKLGSSQKYLDEHIQQHQMIQQMLTLTPGLVPNSQTGSMVPDHSITTAEEKQKLLDGAKGGEAPVPVGAGAGDAPMAQ